MAGHHFRNINILKTTSPHNIQNNIFQSQRGSSHLSLPLPSRGDGAFQGSPIPWCCVFRTFSHICLTFVALAGWPSPWLWSHWGWVRGHDKNAVRREMRTHFRYNLLSRAWLVKRKKIVVWIFVFVVSLSFTVRWLTIMMAFAQNLCSQAPSQQAAI